jgi:hypothetical protein
MSWSSEQARNRTIEQSNNQLKAMMWQLQWCCEAMACTCSTTHHSAVCLANQSFTIEITQARHFPPIDEEDCHPSQES